MPTITVSAADSATAMDQIIAQLGEDAMILDTTTRDGKLEIRATNDVAFKFRKPRQVSDVFTRIMHDELNPPEAGDRAKAAASAANASGPVLNRKSVDEFWKKIEGGDDTGNADEHSREADELRERESEINIRMRRLQWENERLSKETNSLKDLSREAVDTARMYFEKSEQHQEETTKTLDGFRNELTSLKEMITTRQREAARSTSRRRFAFIALACLMGLSAGAYAIRDRSEMLLPMVDTFMSTIGATVNVSMEYFKVSDLEAVRLGDIIRIKGKVTNNYPLSADAPVIRFMVKDDQGLVLTERDVVIDQPALRPGRPAAVSAQLELATRLDDDVRTDIIAIPVERASRPVSRANLGT
ncbi:hypothetical protein AB8880_08225 [Alphaproteobacteria bacterium LSUCC0684]